MARILRFGAPALAMVLLIGCGSQENAPSSPAVSPDASKEAPAPAPSTEAAPTKDEAPGSANDAAPGLEGPKTSAVKLEADEIANIKKLPADEVDAALKQAVCPVSDHNLGSMDVPVKITAEGRTFYLCCEGCKGDVAKDPQAVIAKLDKK